MGPQAKLPSLDLGRFVAALLVALFHQSFIIYDVLGQIPGAMIARGGHSGVEFFFILSGFIILYVHRLDIQLPSRIGDFAWKRIVRIIPGLWLVLIPWAVLSLFFSDRAVPGAMTPTSMVLDLFLIPHTGPVLLALTWTLRREFVFYATFCLLLFNRRIGAAALSAWQLSVLAVALLDIDLGVFGPIIFGLNNIGFGIGMLIAMGFQRMRFDARIPLALGLATFVGAMIVEWWVGGPLNAEFRPLGDHMTVVIYTAAAALIVLGLVKRDSRRPAIENNVIATLGGASYLLYLVHAPAGSVMVRIFAVLPFALPPLVILAIMLAASVTAATVLHLFVERPIMRWLRGLRISFRQPQTA